MNHLNASVHWNLFRSDRIEAGPHPLSGRIFATRTEIHFAGNDLERASHSASVIATTAAKAEGLSTFRRLACSAWPPLDASPSALNGELRRHRRLCGSADKAALRKARRRIDYGAPASEGPAS
jgi:hypothetical protein